jgi:hypothetical protein
VGVKRCVLVCACANEEYARRNLLSWSKSGMNSGTGFPYVRVLAFAVCGCKHACEFKNGMCVQCACVCVLVGKSVSACLCTYLKT